MAARQFVLGHGRGLSGRAQLRFAVLALLAVFLITILQALVMLPIILGKDELPAFFSEAWAWAAENTGVLAFVMAFVTVVFFAVIYFASGWLSRWFAKRLAATGKI